ncbi:MAG: signal recognition particle-docking protein FtsY [archaeon]
MFNNLKKKLGSWFKKTEKKAEGIEVEEEVKVEEVVKEKKPTEVASPKLKIEKPVGVKERAPVVKEQKTQKIIVEAPRTPEQRVIEKQAKKARKSIKDILKRKITISQEYVDEIFEPLETLLLENNVALIVTEKIKKELDKDLVGIIVEKKQVEEEVKKSFKRIIADLLLEPFDLIKKIKEKEGTFTILFFGINGSGKTTSIAKIANLLKKNNISCVLAASDTFRAASIEQLQSHGEALKIKVIKQHYGADPAAVAYDAIDHARAHKIKVVLIDTAGRMHTKENLMKEMEKISRVSRPDLKIFIGESITGNDATNQAKMFNELIGIDGIILSKADVDEKSGTVLSVSEVTGQPILYLGTGQKYEDLELFSKSKIMKSLGL